MFCLDNYIVGAVEQVEETASAYIQMMPYSFFALFFILDLNL